MKIKGSPKRLNERIPLALTLPSRSSSPKTKGNAQTGPEIKTRFLLKDSYRGECTKHLAD